MRIREVHDLDFNRPHAAPLEQCAELLGVDLATVRAADRPLGIEPSARPGRQRWRAERSLSWLLCHRRLQVRWDRSSGRFFAFAEVACALVCLRALR